MYGFDWLRELNSGKPRRWVITPTVWSLGFTSLFTDISSEMVSSILPLYLVTFLGLNPLQFGVIDGLYQGVTAFSRLASGFLADKWRRHKEVAIVGYGLSAIGKAGFLVVGSAWGAIASIIALDRTGKGIRTAPRDALIAQHSEAEHLGLSFGVHRALDTVGAAAGPATAFLILSKAPNAFSTVFVTSFCAAIVGLAILALFVENRSASATESSSKRASVREALTLIKERSFRRIVVMAALLSIATMSDSFIYLALQSHASIPSKSFPLLYLGTALFYILFAVPFGRISDRLGRTPMFIAGHLFLLIVYSAPLASHLSVPIVIAALALFGAYFAATDGVLMAMAAQVLPAHVRASGMATITTVSSTARFFSSLTVGWLWSRGGSPLAAHVFLALLACAVIGSTVMLRRSRTA